MKNRTSARRSNSGLIFVRNPRSLAAMSSPTVPISESKRSGEPSSSLFIQYQSFSTQFQTQTDDLIFAWTNRAADYVRLTLLSEGLNHKPLRQRWYSRLHFFRDGRRD
jgi:hypothetical protein